MKRSDAPSIPVSERDRAAMLSNPWFAALAPAIRSDIVGRGRVLAFTGGTRIFRRGEMPSGVYVVLEGVVRVSGVSRGGRETILDFYRAGDWIGEVALLAGLARTHDGDANGAVRVLRVGAADVEVLLAAHPSLSRALLRLEAQRLALVLTALDIYSTQTLEQRLAHRLLLLAARHGVATPRGIELGLKLSQETLARLIGATRQRVAQVLAAWAAERIIVARYGRVMLVDGARVEALARG